MESYSGITEKVILSAQAKAPKSFLNFLEEPFTSESFKL